MSRPSEFPADTFVAAAGRGVHLLRQRPPAAGSGDGDDAFSQVVVAHNGGVGAVRWNRNNKVVASGCSDGQVQLLYSSGQVMAVLPRDGATRPADLGAVTALSWSGGSKRLAAGSDRGSVFVFDMAQQNAKVGAPAGRWEEARQGLLAVAGTAHACRSPRGCAMRFGPCLLPGMSVRPRALPCAHAPCHARQLYSATLCAAPGSLTQLPPTELPGHLGGVTAVEYQHEDKFLAVARWVLAALVARCRRCCCQRCCCHGAAWRWHRANAACTRAAWPTDCCA